MKYLLSGFFCIAAMSSACAQLCIDLPDGTYRVKMKSEISRFQLTIDHNQFTKRLKDNILVKGNIEKRDCLVYFENNPSNDAIFERLLKDGLGEPVMQIIKIRSKAIHFTIVRSRNLNVVLSEGILKKIG